jgi:hypothetical protein
MRVGLDLSVLGFTSLLSVVSLLQKAAAQPHPLSFDAIGCLIVIQFMLVAAATFFTGLFDSPTDHKLRTVGTSGVCGWVSICLSAAVLYYSGVP